MGIDIETLASWPFPGGIYEDPRPGMRPPGLEDMTGMYALRLVCERVIEAESAHGAHDLLAAELGETARAREAALLWARVQFLTEAIADALMAAGPPRLDTADA